jgi:uncharacterized membrane protein
MPTTAQNLFKDAEREALVNAIKEAELRTSGEIRVYIEDHCPENELPYNRALAIFADLKMHETGERNGVLFYLAVVDKRFVVLGDQGIHQKVPAGFWDGIRDEMRNEFKMGRFLEGMKKGIERTGLKLRTYFPRKADDVNELSDDIIIK